MVLILILFLGMLSFSTEAAIVWTERESKYLETDETQFEMMPLRTAWSATTKVRCVLTCSDWIGNCSAFIFNSTTGKCILGRSVCSASELPLEPLGGTLYTFGFSTHHKGSVKISMWISSCKVNFATAEQSCREKGGHLISLQTPEKMDFFLEIANLIKRALWIGADDRLVEDVFRWHYDNSVMTRAQRKYFSTGNPSKKRSENCVQFNPRWYPLNDINCDLNYRYICEPATI